MKIDKFHKIESEDNKIIIKLEKTAKFYMDLLYYLYDKPNDRTFEEYNKEITLEEICKNQNILNLYNNVKDLIAISKKMKFIKIRSGNSVDEDVYFMVEDIDFPLTDSGYDEFFNHFTQKELIDMLNNLNKIKIEGHNKLFSQSDTSLQNLIVNN